MSDENENLERAIKAGATGYISKDKDAAEIAVTLRDVHQGHSSFPNSIAGDFLKEPGEKLDSIADLSDQERDIFIGLALGETDVRLARRLAISERTVRRRLSEIRTKFSLTNRKEAARFAIKLGLDKEP